MAKGMGFKAAAKAAGGGKKGAAIVAAASRNASPAAKRANPNLLKVKGKPKGDNPKDSPAKERMERMMGKKS